MTARALALVPELPIRAEQEHGTVVRFPGSYAAQEPCFEQHYSVQQVAAMWNVSCPTVRKTFRGEPGVIEIGSPERRHKRGYVTMQISASAIRRVYEKLKVA